MPEPPTTLPVRLAVPDPGRLDRRRSDYAAILAVHERAMAAGEDGYPDPVSGNYCFTAAFLWELGVCCGSGCRHCPYVNQAERAG
jgi:uncharacterized protein DUF5522